MMLLFTVSCTYLLNGWDMKSDEKSSNIETHDGWIGIHEEPTETPPST